MGSVTRAQRVGRYELVQILGEGGMGRVWLAHPYDAPDQLYAVKTVSAQYASDNRVCTMFVKEASLAAAIDHPNVVRLHDVGLHEDVPFFVMEWIDGYSLREVARTVVDTGERVPPSIALRIASDLCGGLHAAHELRGDDGQHLGLVHRDVSPHNVLVTRDGVAKLIDFGVAKARDLATGTDQSVCGGLKGKVRYMAPEQALEQPIDRRADLFSVGAVIYQLLTGRAPFEGPNELAIINALLSTNPVFVPDTLPEPVQWILRRALARRPENRFADAAEMQNAIELALVELGQPDTHADVAKCLAWFDRTAIEEQEELTSARAGAVSDSDIGTQLLPQIQITSLPSAQTKSPSLPPKGPSLPPKSPSLPPKSPSLPPRGPSLPPPPLAFAMPTATSIPARVSSLPDDDEMAPRRAAHSTSGGSWRFVLLGGAFVGALGIGAALLVRDAPASTRKPAAAEAAAAIDNAPLPAPTATTLIPRATSTTTPIIDMGDLDDRNPARPSGKAKPRRPTASPPPAVTTSPPAPAKSGGDLAGPVKVWK